MLYLRLLVLAFGIDLIGSRSGTGRDRKHHRDGAIGVDETAVVIEVSLLRRDTRFLLLSGWQGTTDRARAVGPRERPGTSPGRRLLPATATDRGTRSPRRLAHRHRVCSPESSAMCRDG
nr:hypothetical protein GCM10017611_46360 [Rhodococcus wratislaviensis]